MHHLDGDTNRRVAIGAQPLAHVDGAEVAAAEGDRVVELHLVGGHTPGAQLWCEHGLDEGIAQHSLFNTVALDGLWPPRTARRRQLQRQWALRVVWALRAM